jgi:hypothetical protein
MVLPAVEGERRRKSLCQILVEELDERDPAKLASNPVPTLTVWFREARRAQVTALETCDFAQGPD